jgi:hypothetical protein
MPYDISPSSFFGTGYSYSSANKAITFSTANSSHAIKLAELTNSEANQTTGDARKLAYAIMVFIEQRIAQLGGNKPTKMTISTAIKNGSIQASSGGLLKTYVITFFRSNSSHYDVTPE